MHFLDDSLLPENQQKLVIQVAPYGPEWLPGDADDLPLTMDEHVQAAVDCYNAGATVLHIHVRELDGHGSKRMSKFNELIGRLREAVPDMVLQIGGSISFAPEDEGSEAKWLSYDTRHLLAELDPRPDQVTIAINTSQMNIVEIMSDDDLAGTSIAKPDYYAAYRDMVVEAGPTSTSNTSSGCTRTASSRTSSSPPWPSWRPSSVSSAAACTPALWSSTTWPSAAGSPGGTRPT